MLKIELIKLDTEITIPRNERNLNSPISDTKSETNDTKSPISDPLVKKNHLCGEKNEYSAFYISNKLKDNGYINLCILLIFK